MVARIASTWTTTAIVVSSMARDGIIVFSVFGLDAFLIGHFCRWMENGNVISKSLLIPGHRPQLRSQFLQHQGRNEMSDPIKDGVQMSNVREPPSVPDVTALADEELLNEFSREVQTNDYSFGHSSRFRNEVLRRLAAPPSAMKEALEAALPFLAEYDFPGADPKRKVVYKQFCQALASLDAPAKEAAVPAAGGDEFTRSFNTRGTIVRRRCNIFEIICQTVEIANRVADQLRTPPLLAPADSDAVREAFRAGYWAWCGPANPVEYDLHVKEEQESWDKYKSTLSASEAKAVEIERKYFAELMTGPSEEHKAEIWRKKAFELAEECERLSTPPAVDHEAVARRARLRFFRDLIEADRIKFYKAFDVLPQDYDEPLTLGIEGKLFNAILSLLAPTAPAQEGE